jgi:hypothetical protein
MQQVPAPQALSEIDSSAKKFCCKGPLFVVSDGSQKSEFAFSTRFVLDSPVSRRQHAVVP